MKTIVYQWNEKFYTRRQAFYQRGTLTMIVSKQMIQSVIEKSKRSDWEIELIGLQSLSNRMRDCAKMSITSPLIFLNKVLENLEIEWVSDERNIDYYRSNLEIQRNRQFDPKYMLYKRGRGTKLVETTPFVVLGHQSKGAGQNRGFLARRIN